MPVPREMNAAKLVRIIERSLGTEGGIPDLSVIDGFKPSSTGPNGKNCSLQTPSKDSWILDDIPRETRAFAEHAAKSEGLSINEWLQRVIRDAANRTFTARLFPDASQEDLLKQVLKKVDQIGHKLEDDYH